MRGSEPQVSACADVGPGIELAARMVAGLLKPGSRCSTGAAGVSQHVVGQGLRWQAAGTRSKDRREGWRGTPVGDAPAALSLNADRLYNTLDGRIGL
jgi:hypothetical protein